MAKENQNQATTQPRETSSPSFTIQADHPRNCDLKVQCIPNGKLRGTVKATRTVEVRDKAGNVSHRIPRDQSVHLGQLPEIPGMTLTLFPEERKAVISDPLSDNPNLCKAIEQGLQADHRPYQGPINPVPDRVEENISVHRFKTLMREAFNMVKNGHAKVIKGVMPSLEDIDKLEGRYLLNPASNFSTDSPRFEDDVEKFLTGERKGMVMGSTNSGLAGASA